MSASLNRAKQSVLNFDELFPIGTNVVHQGRECVTESHAGIIGKDTAGVFVSGIEIPVPIASLEIPGWTAGTGRYNKTGER